MTSVNIARRDSICRSAFSSAAKFGTIPEYHTSADNLDFIRPEHLAESYPADRDDDRRDRGNTRSIATQLRNASRSLESAGSMARSAATRTRPPPTWRCSGYLNLSDGTHSLLDIAERADLPFAVIQRTAQDPAGARAAGAAMKRQQGAGSV